MGITNNNTYSIFISERHATEQSNRECHKCRKEFKEGEEIFFKRSNKAKIYHKKCWEKLLN